MTTETAEEVIEESTSTEETSEPDFLSMSDEDISTLMDAPDVGAVDTVSEVEEEDTSTDAEAEDSTDSTVQDDSEDEDTNDSTPSVEEESASEDDTDVDTEKSEDTTETVEETKDEDTTTPQAQLDKLLSPFSANGKQIQVDNVEDAITLMQMGANYNKKMAALKPNLKLVKMLENEGLLDESKLSNLIDLSKKNPAAIKQLIKDSGIDPLQIDVKEDSGYTPDTYTVADTEVELDLVLSDLKDTPKFKETMDVISNKFDAASKKVLVESPAIIRVLNEHMQLGIYDKISSVIERERMLGRLTGLNDIEAYKQVSDAINAQGGLKTTSKETSEKTNTDTTTTTEKIDKAKTKARKKSAASTNSAPSKTAKDFNPLAMSDEDIEKMPLSKYM